MTWIAGLSWDDKLNFKDLMSNSCGPRPTEDLASSMDEKNSYGLACGMDDLLRGISVQEVLEAVIHDIDAAMDQQQSPMQGKSRSARCMTQILNMSH